MNFGEVVYSRQMLWLLQDWITWRKVLSDISSSGWLVVKIMKINVSVGNLVWKKHSDHSINKWNVLYWLYWKLTICKDVLCSNHGTIHDGNAK